MKCSQCPTGILSRTRKPDAIGRIVEKCDTCQYRRFIGGDGDAPALSGSLVRAITDAPAGTRPVSLAPVAVVGQPCPCCHRPVKKLPLCVKCKTNRRVLGKSRCDACSGPAALAPRFCVKCGTKFTPRRGEAKGSAAYRCPAHRPKKAPPAPRSRIR